VVGHLPTVVLADEPGNAGDSSNGKHRLDLTYLDIEASETKDFLNVVLLGYTRTFGSDVRVGVQTGVAFSSNSPSPDSISTQKVTEDGLSDTIFTFQYDFNERLTTNPWVPDTLGLFAQLSAPTGNADAGLGIDAWMLSVGGGWGFELGKNIWLAPALGFDSTFAEGDLATATQRIYATSPIIWLSESGLWIGYAATIAREVDAHEWLYDGMLTVGKMFSNGLGLSLDYGSIDRVGPVKIDDDAQLYLNFYFQFGT
jgi:hypothetical protein